MPVINHKTVEKCREYYYPGMHGGDKIKAIKHLRTEAALDLKSAKYIVEDNFSTSILKEYSCMMSPKEETVGDCIDRLFELTEEMATLHHTMAKLGYIKK